MFSTTVSMSWWQIFIGGIIACCTSMVEAQTDIDFVRDVQPILREHCYECHGPEHQRSGLRLDIKSEAFRGGDAYGPAIVVEDPDASPLYQFVADAEADLLMPPEGEGLSDEELETLRRWILQGGDWPEHADVAKLEDKTDHWAFRPVQVVVPPRPQQDNWCRNDIDRFILKRLEDEGLTPSKQADRRTWLRRVTLDLIGLPPTPDEYDAFLNDSLPDAFERVVDRLLLSPRYGERWAQHWLDVVRYADTHGFEVNTERAHAWPYRDYVIDAFNRDLPYDQFIREQLVGDKFRQDAATGFLVTSAVLLPGQIGQDDASKRLARQDELAEILINTGEAFLGLSIGCARCHDHKFDPISQRDYYSMQAFFTGVHYGDREIQTEQTQEAIARKQEIESKLWDIEQQLTRFAPQAQVGVEIESTDPQRNEITFSPRRAKMVRFTIHDANLHPNLGLIEPCIDEFEIWTAGDNSTNVGLASSGVQVTASGSRESSNHKLSFVNDGRFGNASSWMSDTPGQGVLQFTWDEPVEIERVVWGRDRNGEYQDRLPIAYTLEVGETVETLTVVRHVPVRRPAINARLNVDRFEPVTTAAVRFAIQATTGIEPCLDELEVFSVDGQNVALATNGTQVSSSGDFDGRPHRLEYLNDGRYGNAYSWISNEAGKGWVELHFTQPQSIERIVWSRDREGEFNDRLAVKYAIEVLTEEGQWSAIATSADRRPYDSADAVANVFPQQNLDAEEAKQLAALQDQRTSLKEELDEFRQAPLVYGGVFKPAEPAYLLLRGDPEQPKEEVSPSVIRSLGNLELSTDTPEQQRRLALANWIAAPDNPLTARVIVNRIWQGHFGVGLVETSSDFGRSGALPSHPLLLDWLATEFKQHGWSIKRLHRQIVLSATYRQASTIDPQAVSVDANSRFLWRFPSRRLEAETIRDSILATSGRLNFESGGPGFDLFNSRGGLNGFPPIESFDESGRRRMIYAHKVRMERDVVFGAFDCPDAGQTAAQRRRSTTPIQALNLFNSQFTLDEATALADRIRHSAGASVDAQVHRAYWLAFGRAPTKEEMSEVLPVVDQYGLETLCRVLYNTNEFLFLP